MARKTTPVPPAVEPPRDRGFAADPAPDAQVSEAGLDLARQAVDGSFDAARGTLAWMARWQEMAVQSLNNWAMAFDTARYELAKAHDAQSLLAVQAQLARHQASLLVEQWRGAFGLLLEDELRAAERLREGAQTVAGVSAPDAAAAPAGAASWPVGPLGQAQGAWLGATQRWIEAVTQALPR